MVGADRHQSGKLPLRAGIGLQRHGRQSRNPAQSLFQLTEYLLIARRLRNRRKRMHPRKFRPRHRNHLGSGVQLHRAGAQRDHRGIETDVLPFQASDVTHHLCFGMMRVEDGMCEVRTRPLQRGRRLQRKRCAFLDHQPGFVSTRSREDPDDGLDVVEGSGLVEGNSHSRVEVAEVHPRGFRRLAHRRNVRSLDPQRVEVRCVRLEVAGSGETPFERARTAVDALADRPQSGRSVIHGVHGGDIGQ